MAELWRELCTRGYDALRARALDARGQTASEYMGILLVVAILVAAVIKSGAADTIRDRIGDLVDQISHGG
jgi:hypothetical protein